MVVEIDTHQSDQEEGGRHERAQEVHGLPDQRRAGHLGGRDPVRLARSRENREHTEVERVVGNEERERNTEHTGHDREIGAEHRRHQLDHALGHGVDHLRAGENAGEDAGRENEADHGQHIPRMSRQQRLLLVDRRVVEQHRDGEADHEEYRQRQHGGDERREQGHGERRIHEKPAGTSVPRVVPQLRIGELLAQYLFVGRRRRTHRGEPAAFAEPKPIRHIQHPADTDNEGGNHGHEHRAHVD